MVAQPSCTGALPARPAPHLVNWQLHALQHAGRAAKPGLRAVGASMMPGAAGCQSLVRASACSPVFPPPGMRANAPPTSAPWPPAQEIAVMSGLAVAERLGAGELCSEDRGARACLGPRCTSGGRVRARACPALTRVTPHAPPPPHTHILVCGRVCPVAPPHSCATPQRTPLATTRWPCSSSTCSWPWRMGRGGARRGSCVGGTDEGARWAHSGSGSCVHAPSLQLLVCIVDMSMAEAGGAQWHAQRVPAQQGCR